MPIPPDGCGHPSGLGVIFHFSSFLFLLSLCISLRQAHVPYSKLELEQELEVKQLASVRKFP